MPTILIVDDDEIDRESASRCLRSLKGVEVAFAKDGTEALRLFSNRRPDLVLTDLRMPRMDGLALVERLQEDAPEVPVILMTSQGNEKIAVRALKAGAASYVPKKDLKTDLLSNVRQVLDVAESARRQSEVLQYIREVETRFELPNDPSLIGPVVGCFQDNLKRLGFANDLVRSHVGIALMEALCNAMMHGNLEVDSALRRADPSEFERLLHQRRTQPPYSDRRVQVKALERRDRVEYTIRDEGPGFDSGALPDPTASENLLDITGRGIMLMCTFMDLVEYSKAGNTVRMSKGSPGREAANDSALERGIRLV